MRVLLVGLVLAASASLAAGESAAFVNLVVEPSPALTEPVEGLQKKFFAVARERSGYTLALRGEVEDAVKKARITDFAQDSQLSRVAVNASTKNAGHFTLRLTETDQLLLQGRVVGDDGKLLKSTVISVPRNGETLLEALARASAKFFDALNGVAVAVAEAPKKAEGKPSEPSAPPMVIRPVEPPNPGTPLRIAGGVIGAAGVATTVVGVVLFANAGTVTQDKFGNISISDVGRVQGIREAQGAALGALTAGIALTLTGALMLILAPNAPITAGLTPTPDGALFAVGGAF